MTQVRFVGTGDPTDDRECTVFGHTFVLDEWVEVDAGVGGKLKGNATFEANDKPKVVAPPAAPAPPPVAAVPPQPPKPPGT